MERAGSLLCLTVLLTVFPASARAQDDEPHLAGLIKRLFDQATINAPSPLPNGTILNHAPHFIIGESLKLATRELNVALAGQLSTFPLPSSSGGFTFSFNERGEILPTSSNFGPSFAERAVTIGTGQLNFGFTFQRTSFSSFEGVDLESGAISLIREHNNCCPAGANAPASVTDFAPEFERDLLRSNLNASIDTRTTAFFTNYGVTDRFDIGLAVPIVHVSIDARVTAEILRTASASNPITHSFDGRGAGTIALSEQGSATGLGDILVRAKYNFLRSETTAYAAALDLRLPTGDEDDLLGTGATQAKFLFVASSELGRFSPHVNLGYTLSSGDTSAEATSFNFDPATYGMPPIPTDLVPEDVDLSVPDEVNYTVGFNVAATPYVTVGFDVLGRSLRSVPRFGLRDVSYENRGPGGLPAVSYQAFDEFSVESPEGTVNLLLGVIGVKFNLGSTFILNGTILFPMSDNGLKPNITPAIGFDYVF